MYPSPNLLHVGIYDPLLGWIIGSRWRGIVGNSTKRKDWSFALADSYSTLPAPPLPNPLDQPRPRLRQELEAARNTENAARIVHCRITFMVYVLLHLPLPGRHHRFYTFTMLHLRSLASGFIFRSPVQVKLNYRAPPLGFVDYCVGCWSDLVRYVGHPPQVLV